MALENTIIKREGGESGCRDVIKKSDCRKINERKGRGVGITGKAAFSGEI